MTITYQIESWSDYRRDCGHLWREHYDELAANKSRMKMRPDEKAYEALAASGMLSILTLRRDGHMVGYLLSVVRPHLHYADMLCGFEDAYFLTKECRRGWTGVKMFREWIAVMQDRGVQMLFAMTKPWLDRGLILRRVGFAKTDDMYGMWIGAD